MTLPPALPNAAVLVIDMHRGSIDPPGTVFVPAGAAIVPALAGLLESARAAGVPVIYIVHQIRPDGSDARSPFWTEASGVGDLYPNVREQVIGSEWTALAAGLEPQPGDHVLPKKRYGAFSGNDLAFLLKNLGVETLILTGVETEICVTATAFHAFNEDYRVVVARDGVAALEADLGEAVLRIVEREVGWVARCEEIGAALESAR
ncbi:MAG: cysteine hydrolase [Actinobacteria bacterium]|nr:cysteine hydrolase [Actinomycetota bacterium]